MPSTPAPSRPVMVKRQAPAAARAAARQEKKQRVTPVKQTHAKPSASSPLVQAFKQQSSVKEEGIDDERKKQRASAGVRHFFEPKQKPITPLDGKGHKMSDNMVFDIITAFKTNDPGIGVAALKSAVALGHEFPTSLLFYETLDVILSQEQTDYQDSHSIFSTLLFCYDKAAACSRSFTFPNQWRDYADVFKMVVNHDGSDELLKR